MPLRSYVAGYVLQVGGHSAGRVQKLVEPGTGGTLPAFTNLPLWCLQFLEEPGTNLLDYEVFLMR